MTYSSIRSSAVLVLLLLGFTGCSTERDESPVAPPSHGGDGIPSAVRDEIALRESELPDLAIYENLAAMPDRGIVGLTANRAPVIVPAGSVDALQAAVDAAGPGGVVILESGLHTESATVVIHPRMTILGEAGAVLESAVAAVPPSPTVAPALWIHNAARVTVWGLDIRAAVDPGGAGILVQNSPNCLIALNDLSGLQFPVIVEQGDRTVIWRNDIATSTAWQTGVIPEAFGVTVVNGERVTVAENEVTGALFGIWACDKRGSCYRNDTHDNFIGIILCKVPGPGFPMPDGSLAAAEFSATQWLTTFNDTSNNFDTGLLVIDGANNNLVVANTGSGNGAYDCELTADTFRFGFLTPAAFENTVVIGDPTYVVKDCGNDNHVFGGDQVDTTIDACY